jgi:hypothetical protein
VWSVAPSWSCSTRRSATDRPHRDSALDPPRLGLLNGDRHQETGAHEPVGMTCPPGRADFKLGTGRKAPHRQVHGARSCSSSRQRLA